MTGFPDLSDGEAMGAPEDAVDDSPSIGESGLPKRHRGNKTAVSVRPGIPSDIPSDILNVQPAPPRPWRRRNRKPPKRHTTGKSTLPRRDGSPRISRIAPPIRREYQSANAFKTFSRRRRKTAEALPVEAVTADTKSFDKTSGIWWVTKVETKAGPFENRSRT